MQEMFLLGVTDDERFLIEDVDGIIWIEEAIESEKGKNLSGKIDLPQIFEFDKTLREKRIEISSYVDQASDMLLDYLVPKLNKIHNVSKTKRQWKILVKYWLRAYVAAFYLKYINISNVLEKYKDRQLMLCTIGEHERYIANEVADFILIIRQDDLFCIQQYADIINYFHFDIQLKIMNDVTREENNSLTLSNAVLREKKTYSKECRLLLYRPYLPDQLISPLEDKMKGVIRNYPGIPLNYIMSSIKDIPLNKKMREAINVTIDTDDFFLQFLGKKIGEYIPKAYLEAFKNLSEKSKQYFNVHPRGIIAAPAGFTHDELFKIFLMDRDKKAVLYDVQHGGNHGFVGVSDKNERDLVDKMYTFGWKDHSYKDDCIPMPASIGLKYLNMPAADGNRILYTGYRPDKYCPTAYSIDQLNKLELDFFSALKEEVIKQIVVRPIAPFRGDINRTGFFRRHFPDITIRNHLPFARELASAKLVIVPTSETTYAEALWMNKPLIIIFKDDAYLATKIGEEFVKKLKKVEILHDSPKKAAELVNSISGHEMEWWMQQHRQKVVNEYKRKFAWLPKQSFLIWQLELIKACFRKNKD